MADIRAVIFDFGNVVAFFDYGLACDRLGARVGRDGRALLNEARAAGIVPLLLEFETGRINEATFAQRACQLIGLALDPQEFAAAWQDIFTLNEPVARLVEALHATGVRLLLGSNTNALHARWFRRQFAAVLDRFDHLVLSHEVGHAKPDAAFFQVCVQRAQVPADSCLFIDDLAENVAGARAAGLQAWIYRDSADLTAQLRKHRLLGNP